MRLEELRQTLKCGGIPPTAEMINIGIVVLVFQSPRIGTKSQRPNTLFHIELDKYSGDNKYIVSISHSDTVNTYD